MDARREIALRARHGCDTCKHWHRRSQLSKYYCYAKPELPEWWRCNNYAKIEVNIMTYQPLDDLEIFELFSAAFPEKFKDRDETWDSVQDFADTFGGFDEIADLLGRVVMLTMPMESGLTKTIRHCLGEVKIKNGQAFMTAAVSRNAITTPD